LCGARSQQQAFDDLKQRLCSAPVLSLPDLQQPFEIETNASDYVVGVILTQHGHPMAYHSETLSDVVRKYPTYDKEMYSIVQACCQWRHYILGKETVIHTDHKPLQFMQTQGKLQNDRHQKWSTYLQQFHLNIKYKIGSTNHVVDCLSRPPVMTLTMVLDSCDHETSGWPQLYETDPDFATTYQMLGANAVVDNFHLQDGLLCRLGHICVPSSERVKMIWEAHYSRVAGHFGIKKTVAMLQKHFYWLKLRQEVNKYIRSCTAVLLPNRPLRNRACTPLFLLLTGHGNPSQWTTCRASHPPSGEMTLFLWLLITFLRWRFWLPARRTSQQRPLPSSSLNESGYILESHKPLSQIGTVDFSAHSGRASGHCWTPSSPNPRPSTPRQMAKPRS
jgi:hypothetical protein